MATPCNCDTFTGNVSINGGSLGIGAAPAADESLAVTSAININGQILRHAGTFTLCNGCTFFQWSDAANDTVWMALTDAGRLGIGTTTPQQALDVAGTVRCTGVLLGGDMLLSGGIKDSTGQYTRVDYQGCYYTS